MEMYRKQIAISFLVFTALCMSGFTLNNQLEMKEENRMPIASKNEAEHSVSIDSSLSKASYKPRQYVKIGEMNYIEPSDKQIKND
jgi:CHASE3 domain sensor protein